MPERTTRAHAPLFGFQTPLFARVFAVAANGVRGLPSPTLPLTITFHAPVPPPPKPLTPANGATVTLPVTLSWTPDPNPQVEGYQLLINNTPDFSGGCGSVELCVTGLTHPRDTLPSLPAAGASFPTGHVVIARWHTPSGLSSELQVATNRAFKNPVTDFNTDNADAWAVMFLPSGKLFWRVLGVDVYGVEGPPSAVRTFTIRPPKGPLPPPVPEFPANGATVTAGQRVAFFWQPVTGAARYELQVANSSTFTPPLVVDKKVTGNEFDTSTLPVGTLFWRVRALDPTGTPGTWSVTFQLTVQSG